MEPALRAAFADSKIAESPAIFRLVVDVVKGKKNVPQVLKTISRNKHLKNLPGASKSNICRLVIKGKAVVIQGKAAGAAWCDEHDARATSDRAEPVGTCPNVDSRLAAHSRLMPNQSMQKEREDHGRRQNYAEAFNVACQQRYREVNDKRYLAAGTFRPVSCAKIAQAVTARFADAGKYFNKNLTGDIIMKYVREERGSLVGGIMQFIPDKKGPDAKIPAAILTLGTTHMQMTQVSGEGKETVVDVASTIIKALYSANIDVKKRTVTKALRKTAALEMSDPHMSKKKRVESLRWEWQQHDCYLANAEIKTGKITAD